MAHLLTSYALSCGLKVKDKPFIYASYYPTPYPNYCLIHASSGMSSKNFDYYAEVINLLTPKFKELDIQFIQLGGQEDKSLGFAADLRGATNIHQSAYLIKHAKLLIGNDSCLAHIASSFNTPVITLFGPTTPENHGPIFGTGKKIYIESHRNRLKPSFSVEEKEKTINYILPEDVAQKALDILEIKETINRKTLWIGEKYNSLWVEVIPDRVIRNDAFKGAVLDIRMDYLFDENLLFQNLGIRPYTITTNQPININVLKGFRGHIAMVNYELTEDYSLKFVKDMMEASIPYTLNTRLEDVGKLKLEFFDYGFINQHKNLFTENLKKELENHSKDTIYYKTNKFMLSQDQIFLNKNDWYNNKPAKSLEDNQRLLSHNPDFVKELEYLNIFTE